MIERIHLEIMRAVQETGTVTSAAKKLNLSQSSLSHTVRKMESMLKTDVWERDGKYLRFTQAGNYIASLAQRLLPQLERADAVMEQFSRGKRGMLRIGMECHPCYHWLVQVVRPFIESFPDVDLDVKQEFRFGGMAAIMNHDIDILITPDPFMTKAMVYHPVFDYELVAVVNSSHPLSAKEKLTPSDIQGKTLFTYPVSTERLDIFTHFLQPAGCMPGEHKTMQSTDLMLQMVASGRGICALPDWLVESYKKELPIIPIRLGKKGIHKQINLGIRKSDRNVEYIKQFIELSKNN